MKIGKTTIDISRNIQSPAKTLSKEKDEIIKNFE
jgi:hypothetical protein